jgi:hypothetical protein
LPIREFRRHPSAFTRVFVFHVKVALSGLFGRFVTRAYLERYFGLTIFAHLGRRTIVLDGRRRIEIVRRERGDLPDWVACAADLSRLTVAEAKGCHDRPGPARALARAWAQAGRIDLTARGRRVTLKRIAIATRWGGSADARLSVRDPEDRGEPIAAENKEALFIGLLRTHIANLIAPLGYSDLAHALRELATTRFDRTAQRATVRAREALDAAVVREVIGGLASPSKAERRRRRFPQQQYCDDGADDRADRADLAEIDRSGPALEREIEDVHGGEDRGLRNEERRFVAN